MSPVFLLYILTILLHFLIEFISGGGGRIYNQKVKKLLNTDVKLYITINKYNHGYFAV